MARLNVNPTRMELTRLKKRLATASRGHKLLKDKRDELMKQFLDIVRVSETLRLGVEKALTESYAGFQAAGAVMPPEMLEQTFLYPKQGAVSYTHLKVLEGVLLLVMSALYSRIFPPAVNGRYQIVNTTVLALFLVSAAWLYNATARFVSEYRSPQGEKTFYSTFLMSFGVITVVVLGIGALAWQIGGSFLFFAAAMLLTSYSPVSYTHLLGGEGGFFLSGRVGQQVFLQNLGEGKGRLWHKSIQGRGGIQHTLYLTGNGLIPRKTLGGIVVHQPSYTLHQRRKALPLAFSLGQFGFPIGKGLVLGLPLAEGGTVLGFAAFQLFLLALQ